MYALRWLPKVLSLQVVHADSSESIYPHLMCFSAGTHKQTTIKTVLVACIDPHLMDGAVYAVLLEPSPPLDVQPLLAEGQRNLMRQSLSQYNYIERNYDVYPVRSSERIMDKSCGVPPALHQRLRKAPNHVELCSFMHAEHIMPNGNGCGCHMSF